MRQRTYFVAYVTPTVYSRVMRSRAVKPHTHPTLNPIATDRGRAAVIHMNELERTTPLLKKDKDVLSRELANRL